METITMEAFDISFLDRDTHNTIQRLVLIIESHIDNDLAVITSQGTVIYDPGAVKEFGVYYQLNEYLKACGADGELRKALVKLINKGV